MSEKNNKVDEFLAKLSAKEVYDGDSLRDIVEQSGLPKDDMLLNKNFQDFVIARLSVNALKKGVLCSEKDRVTIIMPMIKRDPKFTERFLGVVHRGGKSWNLGFMGYIGAVVDVATFSNDKVCRVSAFQALERYADKDVNVINYFNPDNIKNMKEPDRFMDLAEKQLDVEMKNMKSRGYAFPFESCGLMRLQEFSKKFPDFKENVGLLVKKAKDNDLIKMSINNDRNAENLIGDIPSDKLEKLRQRAAKAVGLEKVKMPFKGLERNLSQMIFEKKGGKSGR
ncbi:MAG: hypothetical protein MJ210_00005 [Alphaproteobacteria bacterium]|nr:hypothetical protein [Alphaproteobacteria bacterium]